MTRQKTLQPHTLAAAFALLLTTATTSQGQPATPAPSDPSPSTQPAAPDEQAEPLEAVVLEVTGNVTAAPAGTDPLDADAWRSVAPDDTLTSGTQLQTGIRSSVTLRFGDDTVVSILRLSLASIDQHYRTATEHVVDLSMGYGTVRGGTTEGTLRSQVTVESPVATLAKRGTKGWEFHVEPYSGRFRVALAEEGLVEALEKLTGQRRLVRPGQFVDHSTIGMAWVHQAIFDRTVYFASAPGLTRSDVGFHAFQSGGPAPVAIGGGAELRAFSGRIDTARSAAPRLRTPRGTLRPLVDAIETILIQQPPVYRPEGNFGVSPVRILIDRNELKRLRR